MTGAKSLLRAAHLLWADRHNISLSSLREGFDGYLASGVNLLTVGAIPENTACPGHYLVRYVAFALRWGRRVSKITQVGQNWPMRNPDKWSPKEPDEPGLPDPPGRSQEPEAPPTRRGALVGLVVVLLLVVGGLLLTRVLRGMSQLQDCALSGRSNCK